MPASLDHSAVQKNDKSAISGAEAILPTAGGEIALAAGVSKRRGEILPNLLNWFLGIALVYSILFAIGQVIFGIWSQAALLILLAAVSGALMWWNLRRTSWSGLSEQFEPEVVEGVTEGAH